MIRALVAAGLALALAGCAGSRLKLGATEDGEVIEAEGWSPIEADLLATKRRSLIEAQKKAVERVVGVFISAKTRVSQAVAVDQNILANVGGYVKRYDLVSERREDGFYKTVIRAHVLYKKLGADLADLGLVRPEAPPGNPRVRVGLSGDSGADGAVRRVFVERGFQVLDAKGVGGDLEVGGTASARELYDPRLGGFKSWRARVELQAQRAGSGEVLARKTQEASGLDAVGEIARAKALENAGGLAAESLSAELSQVLTKRAAVTLRVAGVKGGLAGVQSLADHLRLEPDIAQVTLGEFGPAGAELKVTTEGFTGEELSKILTLKKYALQVRSVTPYLVEAAVAD
ncbi:MAG: hypothetical protein HYZ75_08245 [Elusimicrobia bacterium]|nr:hypothetical protein [Elusimicrobiota bacterium]